MKVNSAQSQSTAPAQNSPKSAKSAKAERAGGAEASESYKKAGASSADVNSDISTKGKDMAKAKSIASQTPEMREDRIAALKQKIADRKYNVDAAAVADRMVDDHLASADLG